MRVGLALSQISRGHRGHKATGQALTPTLWHQPGECCGLRSRAEPAAAPKQGGSSLQPLLSDLSCPGGPGSTADLLVRGQGPTENFLKKNSAYNRNREINDYQKGLMMSSTMVILLFTELYWIHNLLLWIFWHWKTLHKRYNRKK